ncbi:MAG: FtsQ-type POTRA domain-containing protein [Lawsonibacter sp.]|nr:FtsQ-type POTRA domain-containing protein [Lawsonibacter sp.]
MAPVRNNRRRRRGRGRFGPLFKLLCALTVVVALTMGATVFFQVETVVVSGNSRYTQEEVIQATGIQIGDNLFRMNKYQIAKQVLQALPYVEEVMIRRSLPSTILITVSEWDSVARVETPQSTRTDSAENSAAADSSGSSSAQGDGTEDQTQAAQEAWLISVGGKLLEPAPADSTVLSVTGITPLMPKAGTMLTLPQEEQGKLNALLALLDNLNKLDMLGQVSSIQLGSTQILMRCSDRFDVKMALNADFNYKLRALAAAVEETEKKLGDETTGTFDLTREDFTAVYSPD